MRIQEFEMKTKLTRETIRYYENIKLLSVPVKDSNGYKIYTKEHLGEVDFIKKGQLLGFTLKEIKRALSFYKVNKSLCPDWKKELLLKREIIKDRVEEDQKRLKIISSILQ